MLGHLGHGREREWVGEWERRGGVNCLDDHNICCKTLLIYWTSNRKFMNRKKTTAYQSIRMLHTWTDNRVFVFNLLVVDGWVNQFASCSIHFTIYPNVIKWQIFLLIIVHKPWSSWFSRLTERSIDFFLFVDMFWLKFLWFGWKAQEMKAEMGQ